MSTTWHCRACGYVGAANGAHRINCASCGEHRPVTRSEAALLGLKLYFTGKPCRRGHIAERRAFHGTCLECEKVRGSSEQMRSYKAEYRSKNAARCREDNAKWRQKNGEKVRKDHAQYYAENKDKCRAKGAVWSSANRVKVNAFIASWKAANPDKLTTYSRNRRARIAEADGVHSTHDIVRIRAAQKDKCAMCCARLRGKGHVDHIIAIANGGSNWPRNLQILCQSCNLSKNAKHPITFAQQLGLLI